MRFQSILAGLAIIGLSAALPQRLISGRRAAKALPRAETNGTIARRLNSLTDSGLQKLKSIGFGSGSAPASGVNANSAGSEPVWIGTDGPYTVEYTNTSPNEVVLVVWGDTPQYQASFVESVQPLITVSLEGNGDTTTLSFSTDASGAWAGVYQDTVLSSVGQVQQTWGEFTMGPSGVVDVSREVYTQGNNLQIVGPDCTTNMSTCVFECNDPSVTTCGDAGSYSLVNCAPGSQPGAQSGANDTSGGCGWEGATSVALQATFS